MRVLLVDDVPAMRDFLAFVLSGFRGIEIDRAGDGPEALQKITVNDYDLVLLDINLPTMDGIKVLSLMRQRPATAGTPVIVVTTDATQSTLQRANKLGVRRVITKPVEAYSLCDAIREELGLPALQPVSYNKRRAPRLQIGVSVTFRGAPPERLTTWDINPYGAFLITDLMHPVGTRAHLAIELPHFSSALEVECEVIHLRPAAFGPLPQGLGVCFVDESADLVERLHAAFRSPDEA